MDTQSILTSATSDLFNLDYFVTTFKIIPPKNLAYVLQEWESFHNARPWHERIKIGSIWGYSRRKQSILAANACRAKSSLSGAQWDTARRVPGGE